MIFRSCILYFVDCFTPALVPVKPFSRQNEIPSSLEIQEFSAEKPDLASPFTSYLNHLYVSPISINYSNQKAFSKVMCLIFFNFSTKFIPQSSSSVQYFLYLGCTAVASIPKFVTGCNDDRVLLVFQVGSLAGALPANKLIDDKIFMTFGVPSQAVL